ncbi:BTAD domain-containing putative transcriptional regulator [Streptomyces sp. NPDC059063]|uniref:AfsR/SARP family transcriptional regulator n=1 Tax=unclassified Streptomyces TaxID=2593676 RepID=UPI003692E6F4
MEFRILGQVEVHHAGRQIPLRGAKQRTVLGALLLAEDLVVYDSQLGDFLWGQKPPATVNAQIYTYVSRLRKALGPHARIMRRSPGYLMQTGSCWFDLAEFTDRAHRGHEALQSGAYETAFSLLSSALSLWRGPALADVTCHLAEAVRPRLEELRITALTDQFEAELALGGHAALVPRLTQLVGQYPLQERFRAQLMTALYRCDRQAEALALYEQGRSMLAGSLGIDPGARLHQVMLAILNSDPKLLGPVRERLAAGLGRSAAPRFAVL